MKKSILILFFILTTFSVLNAQFTKVGGGLTFSSGFPFHNQPWDANKSGMLAVSLKGIYEISIPLHVSPSLTIFYPHITKESMMKTTVSSIMFDFNGHYVFNSLDQFEFYGLAGLDILYATKKEKESYVGSTTFKESDNALGLNLGIGTYMKITQQFDIFGEAKYIFSKYDQFIINAGILLNLDWLKKNETPGI